MLTPRWTILRPHHKQNLYWNSPHRFNVLPSGRRSGKTELFKRKLVWRSLKGNPEGNARFFAGAPTRDQAKRIFWDDLKALTPSRALARRPREGDLCIELRNGSELWVVGLDRPERIEGQPWDGGGLDEYGNMREEAWKNHVRPALSDRLGWCDFLGVPEGRNHYYRLYQDALRHFVDPSVSPWGVFHWPSSDILPAEEIAQARDDLDELTFRQEYGGEFVYFHGRAYHAFSLTEHVGELSYHDGSPLILCFDFNAAPGVAAVCQEQMLPSGEFGTGIIGEVYIPRNSNTPTVCRKLLEEWGAHRGMVYCYGDATGGAGGSAKVSGSDWDLIRDVLQPVFQERLNFQVPSANPRERSRLNAMNSRFKSTTGHVRCMVDRACVHVINDFEGVRLIEGGPGEIDKKGTPDLTHLCLAAGTLVDTSGGPIPIERLPKQGKVRTWDGEYVAYHDAGRTLERAPLIELELRTFRRSSVGSIKRERRSKIVATPWHLILTDRGWRALEDIDVGAALVSWRCRPERVLPPSYKNQPTLKIRNRRHTHVVSLKRTLPNAPTYCLRVPLEGCFCLENGIIVSNSDAIGYYISKVFPVADDRLVATPISGFF